MPLRFMTAGESHGPTVTAILEGIPAGLKLDASLLNPELARRQKGFGAGGRMKIERDKLTILSGIMEGKTIGMPISLLVENLNHKQWKEKETPPMTAPRPGHADLTGAVKYGYNDLRPSLERASARETTMRVAVGAICKTFLAEFGIIVGGYVRSIGEVDADFGETKFKSRFDAAEKNDIRCPDAEAAEMMRARINACIREKDTLGGVIEIVALDVPVGLGSFAQWDTRLEAKLAQAVMSVQAIKGVEIGDAFENARLPGTKAHDAIVLDDENLVRPTNRAGGIEGGISNGEPIIIRAAMKPIASTLTPQKTVDLVSGETRETTYERSDFCPVPRAVPVLEAVVAITLADALIEKLGGDSIAEMKTRFATLKKTKLSDFDLDNEPHIFW
ncbi:MAG: chorismate synthase [Anaerolineae bacterium]|jgi:chorismate synthase|nr:chorismate synthase [Anaerolineae bacterium]MBT7989042.1 chorismate synthase [Anaerolineae bacterium]